MNDSTTYQAVRIGDIADWRLISVISGRGMSAYLKHTDPTQEIVTLFEETWNPDQDALLEKIENAVYDHPQVLDDFTADIIVVAPKSIWVPSVLINEDEEIAQDQYTRIYPALRSDVMSEDIDEATCLYTLVPGLNGFLQRTFPGARIHSHLAVMARRFRERSADMPRIYADINEGRVDFIAFDRRNLLMAASHHWNELTDIEYHLFNIMNVYSLNPSEVQVSLSGPREIKSRLMQELRKHIEFVMFTMMPGLGAKAGMPLPAALMIRQ